MSVRCEMQTLQVVRPEYSEKIFANIMATDIMVPPTCDIPVQRNDIKYKYISIFYTQTERFSPSCCSRKFAGNPLGMPSLRG